MRFLMLNWRDPKNPLAGGAERVSLAYLSALAQRGHQVYWFANNFDGAQQEEVIDGIHYVRGGGKGSSVWKAIKWYRQQEPFDLVIDQHHGIPWFAPWWCKTNCVAYIHEVLGPIWSAFYPWPLSAIGRWQEKWTQWLYRRVPFWTPCQATQACLQRHGVQFIKIIPNGVNTVALPELGDKPLNSPLRLVVVSRLAANKRIDHAVLAVKRLVENGIPVRLTIVGTGEMEPRLRRLTRDSQLNEVVCFTGALSEAAKDQQLRQAHFLLHTSLREGWGLNVVEANAMGTPAVVYPVAGLVESTLHGQTGIVTREETPESMADSLAEIRQSPDQYACYRLNAWERAKTMHWSRILPNACDWLEAQAKGGNRRKI